MTVSYMPWFMNESKDLLAIDAQEDSDCGKP
jgi:hypothetical protein